MIEIDWPDVPRRVDDWSELRPEVPVQRADEAACYALGCRAVERVAHAVSDRPVNDD